MVWRVSAYVFVLLGAAAISLAHAVLAWHHDEPVARPAAVLLATMGAWALFEAVRLGYTTTGAQLTWYRVSFVFGAMVPTAWFVFAVVYAGREALLSRRVLGLLAIDPIAFGVMLVTNPTHGLVWDSPEWVSGVVPHVTVSFGPAYYVHIIYAYALVLAGMGLLFYVFLEASTLYRKQTSLLLVGALVPFVANVLFTIGVAPIDVTPLSFAISGTIFGVALFRYDLLNLTPVARAQLISSMHTGLVVANTEDRVVHVNDVAEAVFGDVAIGDPLDDVVDGPRIADFGPIRTLESRTDGRFYDVTVSPLTDFRDRHVGRLVALQDVTRRREYEQRLEVANRLLRHNLRNETGKIMGWAELIEERATDTEVQELAGRIDRVATSLADLSTRAKFIVSTLETSIEAQTVDVVPVLADLLDTLDGRWPAAEFELDAPAETLVRGPGPKLLSTAFANLLENAVEHNDAETPHVEVTVRERDAQVTVEIADNGPGIPELERATLTSGSETQLRHSRGIGLWITQWIVEQVGGTLTIEDRAPRGSVVTITFQQV